MKTIEQAIKDGNAVRNQEIKRKFVSLHVYCNVGSLAEYCLNHGYEDSESPISLDSIENYYSYPEYHGTYADFDGGTEEQRDAEIERLNELIEETAPGATITHIEEEIVELENLETEPQEIYEWWAVSEYLYDNLKEKGYPVCDAGSCYVWGRTTSGQAILLDYVITLICAEMEILEGQTNSWA